MLKSKQEVKSKIKKITKFLREYEKSTGTRFGAMHPREARNSAHRGECLAKTEYDMAFVSCGYPFKDEMFVIDFDTDKLLMCRRQKVGGAYGTTPDRVDRLCFDESGRKYLGTRKGEERYILRGLLVATGNEYKYNKVTPSHESYNRYFYKYTRADFMDKLVPDANKALDRWWSITEKFRK